MRYQEVTDPEVLKAFEASEKTVEVTDPEILKAFETEEWKAETLEKSAPIRPSYAANLAGALQQSNLYGTATTAFNQAKDKGIRRRQDGDWDLPMLAPLTGGAMDLLQGPGALVRQAAGQRLPDAPTGGVDPKQIQKVFHDFQQANNLSDEEVQAAWSDLGNLERKWEDDEKYRVLSNGQIIPNPTASEWLDNARAADLVRGAKDAPEEAKADFLRRLPKVQADLAAEKAKAYEAGTRVSNVAGIAVPGALPVLPPSQWAERNGRTDVGTPEFVRDYESYVEAQPDAARFLSGIAGRYALGWAKVANTALGVAGLVGSDTATAAAAAGTEASNVARQGMAPTGVAGSVAEEIPSVLAQVVSGQFLGAAAGAVTTSARTAQAITSLGVFGTAGLQSAGLTYADEIAQGTPEDEARLKAGKAGLTTMVVTAAFGTGGMGAVERVAAGKAAEGVTVREVLAVGRELGTGSMLRSPELRKLAGGVLTSVAGEATEEGIDQLLSAFLTADPDTSLADAWSGAVEAAVVGGAIGGTVGVAETAARELAVGAAPLAPASARAALEPSFPDKESSAGAETRPTEAPAPEVSEAPTPAATPAPAEEPPTTDETPIQELPTAPEPEPEKAIDAERDNATMPQMPTNGIPDFDEPQTPTIARSPESPTIAREDLKTAFNLDDEQAEVAEGIARALGLTPERVLVEREFEAVVAPTIPEPEAPTIPEPEAELAVGAEIGAFRNEAPNGTVIEADLGLGKERLTREDDSWVTEDGMSVTVPPSAVVVSLPLPPADLHQDLLPGVTPTRRRSLSTMRAEVVRKLGDSEITPRREKQLTALLGRIESAMMAERKVEAPAAEAPAVEPTEGQAVTPTPAAAPKRVAPKPKPRKFDVNPVSDFLKEERDQRTNDERREAWISNQEDRISARDIAFSDWEKLMLDVDKGRRGMTVEKATSMVQDAVATDIITKETGDRIIAKIQPAAPAPASTPEVAKKTPKKADILATSPTQEGIEKSIAKFYGGEAKTLVPTGAGEFALESPATGKRLSTKVVQTSKGFYFVRGEEAPAAPQPEAPEPIEGRAVTQRPDGRWMVQSEENRQRAEAGQRQIGGDRIFDTLEEAQTETRKEIELGKQDAAEKQAREEAEAAEAEREAVRLKPLTDFTADMTPMQRGKAEKVLQAKTSRASKTLGKQWAGEKFEVLAAMVRDGYRPVADGKRYRLELPEGAGFDILRTEYDFALSQVPQPETPAAPQPAKETPESFTRPDERVKVSTTNSKAAKQELIAAVEAEIAKLPAVPEAVNDTQQGIAEQQALSDAGQPLFADITVQGVRYRIRRTTKELTGFLRRAKALKVGSKDAAPRATGFPRADITALTPVAEITTDAAITTGLQDDEYRKKLVKRLGETRVLDLENDLLSRLGVAREDLTGERFQTEGRLTDAQYARHAELEAKHNAGTITDAERQEAQELVDAASSGMGLLDAKHGTPTKEKFTVFGNRGALTGAKSAEKAFFFSDSESVTDTYRLQGRGEPDEAAINQWVDGLTDSQVALLLPNTWRLPIDSDFMREYARDSLKESAMEFTNESGEDIYYGLDEIIRRAKTRGVPYPSSLDEKQVGSTYRVKLRISNPLYFTNEQVEDRGMDAIVDEAISGGYDGIISKDRVADSYAGWDNKNPPSGIIFAVFDPSQIKSADPFTGVPLSERFNPGSPDIRYQMDDRDAEYLAAVERGDMETAQRMVDEKLTDLESFRLSIGGETLLISPTQGRIEVYGNDPSVKTKGRTLKPVSTLGDVLRDLAEIRGENQNLVISELPDADSLAVIRPRIYIHFGYNLDFSDIQGEVEVAKSLGYNSIVEVMDEEAIQDVVFDEMPDGYYRDLRTDEMLDPQMHYDHDNRRLRTWEDTRGIYGDLLERIDLKNKNVRVISWGDNDASPVSYGEEGEVVPLSQRFIPDEQVRYQSSSDMLQRSIGMPEGKIKRLQQRIDAMYSTGRTRGVEDLEAELERLLEKADTDIEGLAAESAPEFDEALPSPEQDLVDAWYRWTGRGQINARDMGDVREEYATFGQFYRSVIGDGAFAVSESATDKQIEEAAKDAAAAYERRRDAMRGTTSTRFQFAGENANMPRFMRDSLETAKAMAAAGKPSEEIRAVTGWFPGKYDGKMRWEIPDTGVTANPLIEVIGLNKLQSLSEGAAVGTTLGELLDHPALFEAYPDLKEVAVVLDPRQTGGSYQDATRTIRVHAREGFLSDRSLSILIHELQHAIQDVEGFAKGTSANAENTSISGPEPRKKIFDRVTDLNEFLSERGLPILESDFMDGDAQERLEELGQDAASAIGYDDTDGQVRLDQLVESLSEALREGTISPAQKYFRTAGEIEARDVQARARLTPEQLKATAPYSSENIASETAIVLYQRRPQGAKGSAQLLPNQQVLLKGFAAADFTTAAHEMMHGFEMTGYGDLTDAEVATLKNWAGSKTAGRSMMEVPASEKLARGWERYLAEGKAPLARLQALFDKIAGWMLRTYKSLDNPNLAVDISPEVRAIFDKLASRLENPSFITTPSGTSMETADGSPLPPAIEPTPENIAAAETLDDVAGLIRGTLEAQAAIPSEPEIPDSPDWNPEGLYSMQERRALEEAETYGLGTDWKQARRAFEKLWQSVVNAEAAHQKARPEAPSLGSDFLTRIASERNPDRVFTDREVALLTHEGLRRKGAVQRTLDDLTKAEASGDLEEIRTAYAAHDDAMASYQALHDLAAGARTASGRSLNAWRYALRDDYSYATLFTRHLTKLNASRRLSNKEPVTTIPKEEIDALRKYSAEQEARIAEMKAEMDRMEGFTAEQQALIEELIAERKAKKKPAVSGLTKKLIADRVKKAATEARERLAAANQIDVRYQSEADPLHQDRILVMADDLLADPQMSDARFAELVRLRFKQSVDAAALRRDTEQHLRDAMDDITGEHVLTAEEIMAEYPEDAEVDREMVMALARAHIYEGARNFEVLDRVHATIHEQFPATTREQVAQLFTRYGEFEKLPPDELEKALRTAKSLELVQKQIDDLTASGRMKRTGRGKDDPSVELRELRKKRDDLAKDLGYVPRDPETQLSSAQAAAKKRLQNEIEEIRKALESGTPRVRVRRGVEYTEDLVALRQELDALRAAYQDTFGRERTPAEIEARILKDLDRRIAREQDLIERGLMAEPESARPAAVESAEITARRQKLADLRQQKRDAYERANPGALALAQAMDAAEKALAKRQAIVAAGVPAAGPRKARDAGITPTAELTSLWEAADALDDVIREIRRERPRTPAQELARLDAAYDRSVQTREVLRRRIAEGDIATAPRAARPTEARTEAVRRENDALRKTLTQMQRDKGVGPFSPEFREARREEILKRRLAEIRQKTETRDFQKKTRTEPATNQRIRELEADIYLAKMKFETDRAKYVYSTLTKNQKLIAKASALYQARMMLNLTGDLGTIDRQLGKLNFVLLGQDLRTVAKRLREGRKPAFSETMIADVAKKAYASFMSEEKQVELYRQMSTDPRYPFHRKNGFDLLSPHDTSHELNADGKVRLNPLEVINDRMIAALMLTKGIGKMAAGVATGGLMWKTLLSGAAMTVAGAAGAVAGRRVALRIERANQTILNVARWHLLETALQMRGDIDASASPDFAKDVTIAVMTMTGKTAGTGAVAKFVKNNAFILGHFLSFPQYRYTNFQSVFGGPYFRLGLIPPKQKREAAKVVGALYGHWLAGYATKIVVAAAILGTVAGDDDEETAGFGIVMDVKSPNFGTLKVGKTYIDFASGARQWLADAVSLFGTETLDKDALAQGYVIEKETSGYDRAQAMDRFLRKNINPNIKLLWEVIGERRTYDGGDLTKLAPIDAANAIGDEVIMNLTVKEFEKIMEEHGPVEGPKIFAYLMLGNNVNVSQTAEEKAIEKAEKESRYAR